MVHLHEHIRSKGSNSHNDYKNNIVLTQYDSDVRINKIESLNIQKVSDNKSYIRNMPAKLPEINS